MALVIDGEQGTAAPGSFMPEPPHHPPCSRPVTYINCPGFSHRQAASNQSDGRAGVTVIDRRTWLASASASVLLGFVPSAQAQTAAADTDWTHYANDAGSMRYDPLDQINAANFNSLEPAWRFSTDA